MASFERVKFPGAAHLEVTERGRHLHVYGTFEQAIRLGVPVQAAAEVFRLLATNGGCVSDHGVPVVSCESHGCPGSCHLYSVPMNWKFGDPSPTPEPDATGNDPSRIYFCLCQ